MRGLGCRLLADQRVPVGDGISLSADVYVPKAAGRYPAIVQFAAYCKELHTAGVPTGNNEIGSPPVFTDRGYAPVVLTRRGMGRSQGEAGVFFNAQDVDDHARAIAWAAEQPWCNGEVVLFGTSYYGMTQPLVAVRRPPALKAFFCNEICTDYFRHLDAVRRRVRALLRIAVGRRQFHRAALPPARAAARCARWRATSPTARCIPCWNGRS